MWLVIEILSFVCFKREAEIMMKIIPFINSLNGLN